MAEAYLNLLGGNAYYAESAGIEPGKLNPVVVRVLQEDGIDIAGKQTNAVEKFIAEGRRYDYLITVCDETSAERCPVYPGAGKRLHWGFRDPSALTGSPEEILAETKKIRDEIKEKVLSWLKTGDAGESS
jgi:arsenate reductase